MITGLASIPIQTIIVHYPVSFTSMATVLDEATAKPIEGATVSFEIQSDQIERNVVEQQSATIMITNSEGRAEQNVSGWSGGILRSKEEEIDILFLVAVSCQAYEPKQFELVRKFAPAGKQKVIGLGTIKLRPIALNSAN